MATIQREKFVSLMKQDVTQNVPQGDTHDIKLQGMDLNVGSHVGSMSEVQLTERQRKICDLIRTDPLMSAKAISEVLSVVPRTVERELGKLQHQGVIRHEGNTSAGRWVILKHIE